MTKAIILLNTDVGMEEEVSKMLSQISEVKEIYVVYGVYDVVAVVEAESFDSLRNIIVTKIRKLPHIKSTTTLVVVER